MDLAAVVVVVGSLAVTAAALASARRARRSARDREGRARLAETARQQQQLEADEERAVRELVLSTMQDGILLLSRGGDVAFANDALEGHLRTTPASLEGVLPVALRSAIIDCRERGEPTSVEVETGVPARWLRGTVTPAAGDSTLVVVRDVTEQRRLEAIRRDFVANASHELKTPAATIQAAAETLRQVVEDDPDSVPRFASQLEREAVRLSRIVGDLLDLSRLESGSSLDEVVSLGATARDETQRLTEAAERAGVTLKILTEGVGLVPGSGRDLALLVRNLVDNAIRYSHGETEVVIQVWSAAGSVFLRVSDTGIGIPSRDISRIFERFYRVDRARSRETGGTGLGLALVKHVVENHRGQIEVESELGRGTTFTISLPGTMTAETPEISPPAPMPSQRSARPAPAEG